MPDPMTPPMTRAKVIQGPRRRLGAGLLGLTGLHVSQVVHGSATPSVVRKRTMCPSGLLVPCGRSGQAARHQFSEGPMRAFIFPGQGSQSVGMGAALAGA